MRYSPKLLVCTLSLIWLSHSVACLSSFPNGSRAEDQGTQQSKQPNLNDGTEVDKREQKRAETDGLAEGRLTDAQVKELVEVVFEGLFEANGGTISLTTLWGLQWRWCSRPCRSCPVKP